MKPKGINKMNKEEVLRALSFMSQHYKYKARQGLFVSNDFINKVCKCEERLTEIIKQEQIEARHEQLRQIDRSLNNKWGNR